MKTEAFKLQRFRRGVFHCRSIYMQRKKGKLCQKWRRKVLLNFHKMWPRLKWLRPVAGSCGYAWGICTWRTEPLENYDTKKNFVCYYISDWDLFNIVCLFQIYRALLLFAQDACEIKGLVSSFCMSFQCFLFCIFTYVWNFGNSLAVSVQAWN